MFFQGGLVKVSRRSVSVGCLCIHANTLPRGLVKYSKGVSKHGMSLGSLLRKLARYPGRPSEGGGEGFHAVTGCHGAEGAVGLA